MSGNDKKYKTNLRQYENGYNKIYDTGSLQIITCVTPSVRVSTECYSIPEHIKGGELTPILDTE